nr:MAG TPA: hypothetical protein [Caudoviricetes sp.]
MDFNEYRIYYENLRRIFVSNIGYLIKYNNSRLTFKKGYLKSDFNPFVFVDIPKQNFTFIPLESAKGFLLNIFVGGKTVKVYSVFLPLEFFEDPKKYFEDLKKIIEDHNILEIDKYKLNIQKEELGE